jgi:hypothetical protein
MNMVRIAAFAAAAWLTVGAAQALTPLTQPTQALERPSTGLVEQAQYFGEDRRGWERRGRWDGPGRGWGPGGRPRVVCRVVPQRVINERTGRVRIVQREVCRRRW